MQASASIGDMGDASGGMSTHDTLKVATIFGASDRSQQDVGSLEPGKLADLMCSTKTRYSTFAIPTRSGL